MPGTSAFFLWLVTLLMSTAGFDLSSCPPSGPSDALLPNQRALAEYVMAIVAAATRFWRLSTPSVAGSSSSARPRLLCRGAPDRTIP